MEFFIDFYENDLKDLDFWFVELLLISYFSTKVLNYKIYKHQKLAIIFNLTLSMTKIIVIILSFFVSKSNEYSWYKEKLPFYKILFGIII